MLLISIREGVCDTAGKPPVVIPYGEAQVQCLAKPSTPYTEASCCQCLKMPLEVGNGFRKQLYPSGYSKATC